PVGNPGYTYPQVRGTDVRLTDFSAGSILRWRDSTGEVMIVGADDTPRWIFECVGLNITAADATLNGVVTAVGSNTLPAALSFGSWDLRQAQGTWEQVPPAPLGVIRTAKLISGHSITATADAVAPSSLAVGTYYYALALRNSIPQTSGTATAGSVTTDATNSCVRLNINARVAPVSMRLWRGTSAGVYDRYVDIPLGSLSVEMFDQGTNIAGYAWITTGVPAVTTQNSTLD